MESLQPKWLAKMQVKSNRLYVFIPFLLSFLLGFSIAGYQYAQMCIRDSSKGHLNNEKAAEACMQLANRGVRGIILGHVSKENNHKKLAYEVCCRHLTQGGVRVGTDIALTVARRTGVTGFYTCLLYTSRCV